MTFLFQNPWFILFLSQSFCNNQTAFLFIQCFYNFSRFIPFKAWLGDRLGLFSSCCRERVSCLRPNSSHLDFPHNWITVHTGAFLFCNTLAFKKRINFADLFWPAQNRAKIPVAENKPGGISKGELLLFVNAVQPSHKYRTSCVYWMLWEKALYAGLCACLVFPTSLHVPKARGPLYFSSWAFSK